MATYVNPLAAVSDAQLKVLCGVLWDWRSCGSCAGSLSCSVPACPAFAVERLSPFLNLYRNATSSYVPEFSFSGEDALKNHEDLFDLIRYLKAHRDEPRSEVLRQHFSPAARRENLQPIPTTDQERALNLAVRVMTTVCCVAERQASGFLETGIQPLAWTNDISFNQFMSRTFPMTDHPHLNDSNQHRKAALIKDSLRAKRLTKVARLSLVGTDDLKDHLKLNYDKGLVEVFRHTRMLKEYLAASQSDEEHDGGATSTEK